MENGAWNAAQQDFAEPSGAPAAAQGFDAFSEFRLGVPGAADRLQSKLNDELRPVPAPTDELIKPNDSGSNRPGDSNASAANDPIASYYDRYQPLGPQPGTTYSPDTPSPGPDGPKPKPNQPDPYAPDNPYSPDTPQPGPDNPDPDCPDPQPQPRPRPRPRPRPQPCPPGPGG